jgi:hypothetical protein
MWDHQMNFQRSRYKSNQGPLRLFNVSVQRIGWNRPNTSVYAQSGTPKYDLSCELCFESLVLALDLGMAQN